MAASGQTTNDFSLSSGTCSALATPSTPYDAILVVSFGGPEQRDDVIPFLENVLRGKNVPHERLLEVAEHYYHFGGVSPINAQVRTFISALEVELRDHKIDLPVYWGNRNWHPLLPDTLTTMHNKGVKRALAFMTSAYSSFSGCRQYREDILRARESLGGSAPAVDKVRVFYNHPSFIQANVDRIRTAAAQFTSSNTDVWHLVFTAHSIPMTMADNCNYELQLRETCRLIAGELGLPKERWRLVYQSRSGRPQDPWLEPDVVDYLGTLHEQGVPAALIAPVGFLSDHMEVLYDLDEEAKLAANGMGMEMVRAETVGTHPLFIAMVRELISERLSVPSMRRAIGHFGPNHDVCPANCCQYTVRQAGRPGDREPVAGGPSPSGRPGGTQDTRGVR